MRSSFVLVVLLIFFAACDQQVVVSENQSVAGVWNKSEEIKFTLPQMDSVKKFNMFLHLRNTNDYKYSNLFVIASMTFPHGKTITDTLEYRMAQPDGTWLGSGIGSVKENKLWYKENVSFTEAGNYVITLSQAMRNNGSVAGVSELEGITDIGYSIELSELQ